MKAPRRAAARIRDARSIPLLALLLATLSAPLSAGEREQPRGGSSGDRHAVPSQGSSGGGRSDGGSSPRFDPPSRQPSSPPPSTSSGGGSDRGREPRVAVPRSGGNGSGSDNDYLRRQRPHDNDRGGRNGRGGYYGGGGGYYGGGYYGYYPRYLYYGPSWGWGLGWWWDDHLWYGAYPGRYHYPYGYDRYDRYDRYNRNSRYREDYNTAGALDLDVAPGRTQVWLDGRYTGTVDDFDGFPEYLWLDRGTYDLVLFLDGYKTVARQITVRPGSVMSIDDRLERGESVRPEDLATKTHDRRDERVRSEEERREEISRRDRDRDRDDMADWRERARRRMEERDRYERDRDDEAEEAEDEDDEDDEDREERSGSVNDIGRLRLEILPSDASVYIDGRFIGTGSDVQRMREGLRLEPGEHRIAVVRPGHKAEEREFTVGAGKSVEIDIELESME